VAGPLTDEQATKMFVVARSDPNANNNCWPWQGGQTHWLSDDSKPSGTASKPIPQAIDRLQLDRVVVVVTRWFGGVLLGSGGLVRTDDGITAVYPRQQTR
jgi:putative IMPACT (imprinted ancient) family translation regulator